MIKETLHIKNMGALTDTGLMEISPLTVFIGNSASGKSTIMKTLVLMRYIFKRLSIRAYLHNAHIEDNVFPIRFKDYLRDNMSALMSADTYIRYTASVNGHAYYVEYTGWKLSYNADIPNSDLCFFKEVWVAESRSVIAPLSSQGSLAKNSNLGFFFNETFSEFDDATDAVKHFDINCVGLDMNIVRGGNNQKKFILAPKDDSYQQFELRHASSGIQTTVPLVSLIYYYATTFDFKQAQKRSIIDYLFEKDLTTKYSPEMELSDMAKLVHIHIEEPELSLDPTSQIKLLNEIIRQAFYTKTEDRNIGIVMATHSPYIVNALNLLMKAHDCGTDIDGAHIGYEDLSVYHIISGKIQNLKIQNMHYINTDRLSEDINDIYDKFQALR